MHTIEVNLFRPWYAIDSEVILEISHPNMQKEYTQSSLVSDKEQWRRLVGKHGLDERNKAGAVLCIEPVNGYEYLVKKNSIHYGTLMHPATKLSHMIDLIVVRAGQQVCCKDVHVMRGCYAIMWATTGCMLYLIMY